MGKLVVLDGLDKGKVYVLRSRNIVGRHTDCSFSIRDKGVSGNHCKIDLISQREYMITDLQSSNGTYVNNKRILSQRLKYGDMITLGKVRVLYQPLTKIAQDESTIMLDMAQYMNEAGELTHCGKPLAKEWNFCPYCGVHLKMNDEDTTDNSSI